MGACDGSWDGVGYGSRAVSKGSVEIVGSRIRLRIARPEGFGGQVGGGGYRRMKAGLGD